MPLRWRRRGHRNADRREHSRRCRPDEPGWYADLHTAERSFVVFCGRVVGYARDDAAGRAAAEAFARDRGVPDAQIDWP